MLEQRAGGVQTTQGAAAYLQTRNVAGMEFEACVRNDYTPALSSRSCNQGTGLRVPRVRSEDSRLSTLRIGIWRTKSGGMTTFRVTSDLTGGSGPPARPNPPVGSAAAASVSAASASASAAVPSNPSAEFFQAAVRAAGIPVVATDAGGRIISWNLAAELMFGRSEPDMLGHTLESFIPSEFRLIAGNALQRTLQQRSVNRFEMVLVPQGGKHPIHVGVTLNCVNDAGGALVGVAAWMRDISNRKELEDHLSRTRHMASIGTLAAGVAHQFNNIACGMGTMVEFALATEDVGAMVKALRMSSEACSRISYITQSLLSCTGEAGGGGAGEAGGVPQEPDLADLTEELLRFADAVEPTLSEKGIQLELELQTLRVTAVPRARFGQALQHLLRNAEDALAERAMGSPGAMQKITLRTLSQGDQIMLQFADTGCGIAADDLPHIFDPFFTRKGVQNGGNKNNPGLGLTLVHGVVMDLSGHIWADSVQGEGTTISIVVPVTI